MRNKIQCPYGSGEDIRPCARCAVAGDTDGTEFDVLSFNFDDDTSSMCTGEELNLIRSMAAGSPTTANGSQVIYAGTEAGRVFVTTSADDGPLSGRPDAPANCVVVDPSDGLTAYVGTDLGVFVTHDADGTWTEMGLTSGVGMLPNVAVTQLCIFKAGGTMR